MVFAIATIVAAKVAFGSIGVSVVVDTTAPRTPFEHVWKRSFGSGHAKLTNRPDWQAHLAQAVTDLGLTGVRYHGLFDDDMGVVTGYRTYDWTKADTAWDYQVKQGVTPIVELSFMPAVLANCSWAPPGGGSAVNPGACVGDRFRGTSAQLNSPRLWRMHHCARLTPPCAIPLLPGYPPPFRSRPVPTDHDGVPRHHSTACGVGRLGAPCRRPCDAPRRALHPCRCSHLAFRSLERAVG